MVDVRAAADRVEGVLSTWFKGFLALMLLTALGLVAHEGVVWLGWRGFLLFVAGCTAVIGVLPWLVGLLAERYLEAYREGEEDV